MAIKEDEPTFKVVGTKDNITEPDWIVEVTQGNKTWNLLIPKNPWFWAMGDTGLNLVFAGHYQ
tara:strand:+ start:491 stop:679 length:189 start_codon:yes stop_codon:yes gene_type:complete